MRFAVFGPRHIHRVPFDDYQYVASTLEKIIDRTTDELIIGGGKGVEELAHQYAETMGVPYEVVQPNFSVHAKSTAFDVRNARMIELSDGVIVYWDGTFSGGLANIGMSTRAGRPVHIVPLTQTLLER